MSAPFVALLVAAAVFVHAWWRAGGRRLTDPAALMAIAYATAALQALSPLPEGQEPSTARILSYQLFDLALTWSLVGFRQRELLRMPAAPTLTAINYGVGGLISVLTFTFPFVIPLPTFDQRLFAYLIIRWVDWTATAALLRRWTAFLALAVLGLLAPRDPVLSPLLTACAGVGYALPLLHARTRAVLRAGAIAVTAGVVASRVASGVAALEASGRQLPEPTSLQLAGSAFYALSALVTAILARQGWSFLETRHEGGRLPRLFTRIVVTLVVAQVSAAILWLLPAEPGTQALEAVLLLWTINTWASNAIVAMAGHATYLMASRGRPPGPWWLTLNYGAAVAVSMITFLYPLGVLSYTANTLAATFLLHGVYGAAAILLCIRRLVVAVRFERRWWPGGRDGAVRADVALATVSLAALVVFLAVLVVGGPTQARTWLGLMLAMMVNGPIMVVAAARFPGEVVRGVTAAACAVAATAALLVGARLMTPALAAVGLEQLGMVMMVAVLVPLLLLGYPWLQRWIDRVVFGRTRRQQEELRRFVESLAPETGALACCRLAVAEVVRAMRCTGGGVLLADGESVTHGDLPPESLPAIAAAGLGTSGPYDRPLVGLELTTLPSAVRDALREARVSAVIPLASPRRAWGHLLLCMSPLGIGLRDEDLRTLEIFAAELALVLDSTDLVVRVTAVERSLAHAEKLAAIGELAARIAHDMRNPVTAARSLAQQLAREAESPNVEEHRVILEELERVERQVSGLLRFSRRDEYRVEALDLHELAWAAVEACRSRLERDGIVVSIDAAGDVLARADREKLRQVVVNLIENAADAMRGGSERRLSLTVADGDGTATLTVRDTGPGVPPDVLPRIFAPFFTTKSHGTGLGLAIAQRMVEGLSGRITAERLPEGGMCFRIELPTAGTPDVAGSLSRPYAARR